MTHENLKKHSRLKAYIDKIANTDNGLTPNEWNSFVNQLDDALGDKKQCMYCEKTVDYSSGVFTCEECSAPSDSQLSIGAVMHCSVEFAKYANRYYELCYETEPCWFNKNNHEKYTSNQVYDAFVKHLNNSLLI